MCSLHISACFSPNIYGFLNISGNKFVKNACRKREVYIHYMKQWVDHHSWKMFFEATSELAVNQPVIFRQLLVEVYKRASSNQAITNPEHQFLIDVFSIGITNSSVYQKPYNWDYESHIDSLEKLLGQNTDLDISTDSPGRAFNFAPTKNPVTLMIVCFELVKILLVRKSKSKYDEEKTSIDEQITSYTSTLTTLAKCGLLENSYFNWKSSLKSKLKDLFNYIDSSIEFGIHSSRYSYFPKFGSLKIQNFQSVFSLIAQFTNDFPQVYKLIPKTNDSYDSAINSYYKLIKKIFRNEIYKQQKNVVYRSTEYVFNNSFIFKSFLKTLLKYECLGLPPVQVYGLKSFSEISLKRTWISWNCTTQSLER